MKTRRKKAIHQQVEAYCTTAGAVLAIEKQRKLGKDWVAYAAAAGAALTMAPSAEATIIYSGTQNKTANYPGFIFLNLDGNAVNDFRIGVTGHTLPPFTIVRTALITALAANKILATGASAKKLAAGAIISAGGNLLGGAKILRYATATTDPAGQWLPSQNGYAGVQFQIDGAPHFGWIRIHVADGSFPVPNSVTAIDWAYCDQAGVGIKAGEGLNSSVTPGPCAQAGGHAGAPEPGGLALLAAGAAGVLAWRRRRQSAPTP